MFGTIPFIQNEIREFETYFLDKYAQDSRFLNRLSEDIINSGGKRLRPALAIISGMANNYSREKVFPLAAAIETLHTATLVHDDIIDEAKTRRGKPTISEKHGINMAVYTGDYLLANSFKFLAESGLKPDKLEMMAKASRMICMGEVNQYVNRYRVTTIPNYLKRIMRKTGVLFAASCAMGAFASDCDQKNVRAMTKLGMNMGIIFQIKDDLIDLDKELSKDEGKPVFNDIKSGIATLPFIYAGIRSDRLKLKIEKYFAQPDMAGEDDIELIVDEVINAGGITASMNLKARYLDKAETIISRIEGLSSETKMGFEVFLSYLQAF